MKRGSLKCGKLPAWKRENLNSLKGGKNSFLKKGNFITGKVPDWKRENFILGRREVLKGGKFPGWKREI